jgi:hypothetical protein
LVIPIWVLRKGESKTQFLTCLTDLDEKPFPLGGGCKSIAEAITSLLFDAKTDYRYVGLSANDTV